MGLQFCKGTNRIASIDGGQDHCLNTLRPRRRAIALDRAVRLAQIGDRHLTQGRRLPFAEIDPGVVLVCTQLRVRQRPLALCRSNGPEVIEHVGAAFERRHGWRIIFAMLGLQPLQSGLLGFFCCRLIGFRLFRHGSQPGAVPDVEDQIVCEAPVKFAVSPM